MTTKKKPRFTLPHPPTHTTPRTHQPSHTHKGVRGGTPSIACMHSSCLGIPPPPPTPVAGEGHTQRSTHRKGRGCKEGHRGRDAQRHTERDTQRHAERRKWQAHILKVPLIVAFYCKYTLALTFPIVLEATNSSHLQPPLQPPAPAADGAGLQEETR